MSNSLPESLILPGLLTTPAFGAPVARRRIPVRASADAFGSQLTVIVFALEADARLGDTLRGLASQTIGVAQVLVASGDAGGDDAEAALAHGATRLSLPGGASRDEAQSLALRRVRTQLTMTVDAQTVLAPTTIERLLGAFDSPSVVAARGLSLPHGVRSIGQRGRHLRRLWALTLSQRSREGGQAPGVPAGCVSVYRTQALRAQGGWSTPAEQVSLAWRFRRAGEAVRFALAYLLGLPAGDMPVMVADRKRG